MLITLILTSTSRTLAREIGVQLDELHANELISLTGGGTI